MLTELQEERASLYALDLLDASEQAHFLQELKTNTELQLLMADLAHCRDGLVVPSNLLKPPAHLKNKVLAQISLSPRTHAQPTEIKKSNLLSFPSLIPWALAASLGLGIFWLTHDRQELSAQIASLEAKLFKQETALARLEARNDLQENTIAQLRSTSAVENPWSNSTVSVVWDPTKQAGLLVFTGLPAAEVGKTYQLWVIDSQSPQPISAGVFRVGEDGIARINFSPNRKIQKAAQFAVSLEIGGEKQQPEGPVILAGTSL